MLDEIPLACISFSANSFASVYTAGKRGLVVDVLEVLIIIRLLLERSLRILLRPKETHKLVISIERTPSVRTCEDLTRCKFMSWTNLLDFLLIEFVVAAKVLNEVITPGEASIAAVTLTEGARKFLRVFAERSTMAIQGVKTRKPYPARTLKGIVLLNFRMLSKPLQIRE